MKTFKEDESFLISFQNLTSVSGKISYRFFVGLNVNIAVLFLRSEDALKYTEEA
jgi:hypothetical protein